MAVEADQVPAETPADRLRAPLRVTGLAILALALLGLTGRILSYPLNRDENLFVTVASQLGTGDLYRDLGYNHLPNLAYLFGGVFAVTGTGHYLLAARLVLAGFWLVAIWSIWRLSRHQGAGFSAFLAAAFILLGSTLLLSKPGMLATNNLIPVALVFPAFHCLCLGLAGGKANAKWLFLAGLLASAIIGLKANYIFIAPFFALAVLLAPDGPDWRQRITGGLLPLAAGGIVGGLPTLVHMVRDPEGFFAHTLRYFTELQVAYWSTVDGPKITSLKDKIMLAEDIWLANTGLLALVLVGAQLALVGTSQGWRALRDWKILTLLGLTACGFAVAFIPSPSFEQYFVPPIPFLVLLAIVLAGKLTGEQRRSARALFLVVALLAIVNGAPRLLSGVASLASPGDWETISIGRDVARAGEAGAIEPGARIATLTPVMAIEAGYSVYPEFTVGQFVYRVAPFIADEDRDLYRTTSPATLAQFLDADPPAAILVNREEEMGEDLADYAMTRGYRPVDVPNEPRAFDLYARPR